MGRFLGCVRNLPAATYLLEMRKQRIKPAPEYGKYLDATEVVEAFQQSLEKRRKRVAGGK